MADYFITSHRLPELKQVLFSNEGAPSEVLADFHHVSQEDKPLSRVKAHLHTINQLMEGESILDIKKRLEQFTTPDKWLQKSIATFLAGPPSSMAVIFEQIRRGKGITLEDAFAMEHKMSYNFGKKHDIQEGIRALLIDKDNAPLGIRAVWRT